MFSNILKKLNLPESYISITLGFLVVVVGGLIIYNNVNKQQQGQVGEEGEAATTEEGATSLPTTHTVAAGETLWQIAEKYYSTGYEWSNLAQMNHLVNADYLEEGQVLTIPKTEAAVSEEMVSSTAVEPANKTYTVVAGDSLWNIAVAQYNDGYAWATIAEANNLDNPDIIHVGNVLTLPSL